MKFVNGGVLTRLVGASVVLAGGVAAIAPQAAWASTVTTTEKGNVSCQVGSFGTYTLPLTVKNTYNNSEAKGASESESAKASVVIPETLNEAEYAAGYRSFDGTVPTVWVDNNKATPSPYNAGSNNNITIPLAQIPSSGTSKLKFKVPDLGPFTFTKKKGTDQTVAGDASNGFAVADVNLYTTTDGSGSATPITATCAVPTSSSNGPFVIATINLT
jgi:hypothetical protein